MHSPLANLIEKLGSLRGDRATVANGPGNTSPCWPAPVRKPEAVAPKLFLARRGARGESPAHLTAPATPPGRGAETLVLRRTDAAR
jgi:hypothetical protein